MLSALVNEGDEVLLPAPWSGPDREAAARHYENIRTGLSRIFAARGCLAAEDLQHALRAVLRRCLAMDRQVAGDAV